MRLNQEKKHNRTAERFAQHYLARLDKNKDGYLEQHEVPTATSVFHFAAWIETGMAELIFLKSKTRR